MGGLVLVVTPSDMTAREYRDFLSTLGCQWSEDVAPFGLLDRGDSAIYCNLPTAIEVEHSLDEIAILERLLGNRPRSAIRIDVGHGEFSEQMAFEVAGAILAKWGGMIEDFNPPDLEPGGLGDAQSRPKLGDQ